MFVSLPISLPTNFLLREVESKDINQIHSLAKQFVLLNLPADKKILSKKIETSMSSFSGELPKLKSEYLFVVEDIENGMVIGCSQIIAKHGTSELPHLSFKVLQKNRVSQDLGIGFMHKILRFNEERDGPTEIGGLLVERGYRRHPEKIGRQVSLIRFLYMAMSPMSFSERGGWLVVVCLASIKFY